MQEFEEAKLILERKREEKEKLTEHLRLIIHDSEQRKSKRLEELMVGDAWRVLMRPARARVRQGLPLRRVLALPVPSTSSNYETL